MPRQMTPIKLCNMISNISTIGPVLFCSTETDNKVRQDNMHRIFTSENDESKCPKTCSHIDKLGMSLIRIYFFKHK